MLVRKGVFLSYDQWLSVTNQPDCFEAWKEFFCLWLGKSSTLELVGLSAMECEDSYFDADRRDETKVWFSV